MKSTLIFSTKLSNLCKVVDVTEQLMNRLSSRLLSPDAGLRLIIVVGIALGALPATDTQELLMPFIHFVVPAWYLYIATCLNGFLRRPRALELGFVIGLTYKQRSEIAQRFINRKSIEIFAISSIAASAFFCVHTAQFGIKTAKDSLEFAVLLIGSFIVLFAVLKIVLTAGLFSPLRHDPRPFRSMFAGKNKKGSHKSRAIYALADSTGKMFPSSLSIILKRQLLYILRCDLFGFVLYNLVAFAVTIALVWFGQKDAGALVNIVIAVAPLFVYTVMTEALSESVVCARESGHYSFQNRDLFVVNMIIASAIGMPYVILYFVKNIFFTHVLIVPAITGAISFVFALLGITLAIANRWQYPAWDGTSISLAVFAMASAMIGMAFPIWGFVFPLVSTAIVMVVVRPR